MNQRDFIDTGNMVIAKFLIASQVGFPDSREHLTRVLSSFNYRDLLITLARINLFLQCTDDLSSADNILQNHFCSRLLRDEIVWKDLEGHFIFSRQATLHLMSENARVANLHSIRSPDTTIESRNELARCYLIANELFDIEFSASKVPPEDGNRTDLLAKAIPLMEYAINTSPQYYIRNLIVRSTKFLHRLREVSSNIDVDGIFYQATGLRLLDYQYLILSIVAVVRSFSPQEILKGEVLFIGTKPSNVLMPLYEKLFQHACISIDELSRKIQELPSLPNEFRLWREYPLLKIENQICCIDTYFLLEKLQTGVFWILLNQLEKEKKDRGQEIIRLRGEVFEDYAASIIKRGIDAQNPCMESCLVNPRYVRKAETECIDIIVCGENTLILLECKAPLLSAGSKFSGDFHKLRGELKKKIIEEKGIAQLWEAIQTLGHTNKKQRRKVEGIDILKVKKIYPVLVLSDRIFSALLMNWFLNSEFQGMVKHNDLKKHLEIMPLTVLTIDDLEFLEPYMINTPFHTHLDNWIAQFREKSATGFSAYLFRLRSSKHRENTFIATSFERIMSDVQCYFSDRGMVW